MNEEKTYNIRGIPRQVHEAFDRKWRDHGFRSREQALRFLLKAVENTRVVPQVPADKLPERVPIGSGDSVDYLVRTSGLDQSAIFRAWVLSGYPSREQALYALVVWTIEHGFPLLIAMYHWKNPLSSAQ
jgi:hypothetical protein